MNTTDVFCSYGYGTLIANLPTSDFFSFASLGTFQIAVPYQGYANPSIFIRENTNGYGNWYKITGQYINI
jgi:hypothetical protein